MIPVVELLRVSTQAQAAEDRAGIPAQREVNRRTCRQYGLRVVETVELVESGVDVAQTAEMAHVLEIVTQGRAKGIVLAEYSRLFRPDRWTDMAVLQVLDDHEAQLYLPTGPVDLRSQVGVVQASVYTLMARLERVAIRDRMQRGKEEKRKRGEHVAGGVGIPFGLRYTRERGWEYTPDIEKVRELFRRFLDGERNYAQLGKELGISRTNVRFILMNPVYTGWRVYDKKRDLSASGRYPGRTDRRKVARAPDELIRVRLPLEPVVSEEEFRQVQEIIQEQRIRIIRKRFDYSEDFLYRGLLYCGDEGCGSLMYANANKGGAGKQWYYCRSHHPTRRPEGTEPCSNRYLLRRKLEPILDEAIGSRLADQDMLVRAVDAHNRSLKAEWRNHTTNRASVQARIDALTKKRDRILETYYEGLINQEQRDAKLQPLAKELAVYTELLNTAEEQPTLLERDAIIAVATVFAEWLMLARDHKRRILEALMPVIFVYRYLPKGVLFNTTRLGLYNGSHSKTASSASPGPRRRCATRRGSCSRPP